MSILSKRCNKQNRKKYPIITNLIKAVEKTDNHLAYTPTVHFVGIGMSVRSHVLPDITGIASRIVKSGLAVPVSDVQSCT